MKMSIGVPTQLGSVQISREVLATLAGAAAMDCYGLVGMASRSQLKDGITELLGRENFSKGIEVTTEDSEIQVDLYIVVGYGVKISEVASNVQSKVKYTLEQMTGLAVKEVNIFVQGVRLLDES
jgi:uncharacterized alkaline shock family protein YloU